jgi:hypothetical protein
MQLLFTQPFIGEPETRLSQVLSQVPLGNGSEPVSPQPWQTYLPQSVFVLTHTPRLHALETDVFGQLQVAPEHWPRGPLGYWQSA